jgi:GAF domain-containing protein
VEDELTHRVVEISRALLGHADQQESLFRVAELACASVPACDAASVSAVVNGKTTSILSTRDDVHEIDTVQHSSGEGPCMDAIFDSKPHAVDSTTDDTRYPAFARAARRKGYLSAYAHPLTDGGDVVGALNLYSRRAGAFDDDSQRIASIVAGQAGIALHHAHLYRSTVELAEQLQEALTSRAVIDQAKGILMERTGCDADQAFELLRQASQRMNRKVRDIAADLCRTAQEKRRSS